MTKQIVVLCAGALLAGCGVADTGAAAVTAAGSKAQEIREGQQAEARVREQLDTANQQAAQQRKAAEDASQ
ncbi:MAG TPA: hypothetical protein VLX90_15415 [Steroidobacteraceae bacterium]|nr:hypothetical protein [Steroidobacteraceae bacterium]